MRSTVRLAAAALVCLVFAGCGGGGGGSGSDVPPDFVLSTNQLSFSSMQYGPAPAAQSFNATATGGTYGAANSTIYFSAGVTGEAVASAEIVNCSGSTCQVLVHPATQLAPGTWTSTVTISACTNFQCATPVGTPKSVSVSYVVSPGPQLISPASMVFFTNANTAPTAQTLSLQSTIAGTPWAATVTYEVGAPGWLNVPSSGTGTTAISIQPAAVAAGPYRARIDFVVPAGGTPTSTEVSLSSRDRAFRFVTPYVAPTNSSAEVTLRGAGFAALSAPVVMFGTTAGTGVQVVSDTEIRVQNPPLPAGQYTVSVTSGGQAMAGTTTFVVVDPPVFPYTAIARSSSNPNGLFFGRLVYDAERQAIYILENSEFMPLADDIERYRFVGGAWVSDPTINFPLPAPADPRFDNFAAIALSPDGKQLLKSNYRSVSHIDPVAWQVTTTVDAGSPLLGATGSFLTGAMSNDGGFMLMTSTNGGLSPGVARYDILEQAFYPLTVPADFDYPQSRIAAPTPEGEQVNLYSLSATPLSAFSYDAGSGTVSKYSQYVTASSHFASYSRDGTRTLLATSLSQAELTVPSVSSGTLYDTYPLGQEINAAVLSPDGTRIYYYDSQAGMLHTLDAHTPPPGGTFPEIGSGVQLPDAPGIGPVMVITPDGGTLILAGTTHLIVMPAP
jgi:hypothetical protein